MRRLIDRYAGIDVGQALLAVCMRLVDSAGQLTEEIRSFGATTPDLLEHEPRVTRSGGPAPSWHQ